jgi:hypothetical protein
MNRLLSTTIAATLALAGTAYAAGPERVRGTIVSATETTLTVHTNNGQTDTIELSPTTVYATATRSSLGAIQPGGFIGTATKTQNGHQVALEVVVFPPSMRGTGEGHYGWDSLPDTTAGGSAVHSSMTNGNVMSAMPVHMTASSMTNGNVHTASGMGGAKQLTVTYTGGQQTITVPRSAPVVALAPGNRADLSTGASVFVVAVPGASGLRANRVVVGLDGVKLPM